MSGHYFRAFMAAVAALTAWIGPLSAETINVPNGSFESPISLSVSVNIDSWQKAAKPDWYVERGDFLWSYNVGLFKNTPASSSDHIDNCDGNQSIWLFVVPEVELFQDYDSIDWSNTAPTHAFDATFEAGKSYHLTVGVIGTGGGMLPGATLAISLYYRDAASNKVTVASVPITNTASVFSNNTHLIDFVVDAPTVKTGDPWAGQHIGLQMLSTVDTNLQGGYWDLDNVRLSAILEPVLLDPVWTNGQFQCTLRSEPGLRVQILSTTNVTLPMPDWGSRAILTNFTGAIPFSDPATNVTERFYRAQRLP
jgi:hypothetical protein